MRRSVTTFIVLWLIGSAINLLFAWLIAWAQGSATTKRIVHDFQTGKMGEYVFTGYMARAPGATWMMGSLWRNRFDSPGRSGTAQGFVDLLEPWQRREFLVWCGSVDAPSPTSEVLNVFSVGWPMRSFHVVTTRIGQTSSHRGGVALPVRPGRDEVVLPYAPLWPGFAANSMMYAALAFLALLNGRVIRQWHRYRRGRCPKCRYDVRFNFASGCTECGWRRQTGQEPPADRR